MNGNNDANALMQRQVLGGILSGVLGGAETAVSQIGDGVTSAIGGVTSAVGPILSPVLPTTTTTSTSARSTSPPSSTSSIPTVSPTTATTSSSSSSSSTFERSSTSSSASSTSSATPTTTSESVIETITTSNGQRHTVFVTQEATPTESAGPPPTHKSFLQNKPLSGFVFALAGVVGLVLIILIATFTMRRQRRKKLTNEALSYEPTPNFNDDMEQRLTDEKARRSYSSSGGGSVHGNYGPTVGYPGYGAGVQYPNYAPRSPNPVYDRSYGANASAEYPSYAPRSPNPAYDAYAGTAPQLPQLNVIGATPTPSSLMHGGTGPVQPSSTPSPPPAAAMPVTRVPSPPQLPAAFGNGSNGSIDERQHYLASDLKVANQ
ncbi:hypothetical protein VNI00_005687 [Paramarasmius palmivorus]|uniref:Uncharacterized protein n=1 Tax=Paramarasmius palmivorus TaxID=297713 RepID=A0AAW0DGB7_9AGAR